MAVTVNPRRDTAVTRDAVVAGQAVGPVVRHRPTGAALTGLTAVVVGAWGALAGYIGPYFGFRPVATNAWNWNMPNGLLHLAPGAAAVVAGLMLLAMGPARRSVRGGALTLPAVLLLAAGAWMVIGPTAWPTFESSTPFALAPSATRNLLDIACASLAPGLVLVMLGGMAWKAATVRSIPVVTEDPMTPREAHPVEPVARDERMAGGAPVVEDRTMRNEAVATGSAPAGTTADEPVVENGRTGRRRGLFSR